ncbi:T9SS type A sorting domain-containing protein [Dyadobacter chenhuakuii]|uniref:T9SS type A sorting domain-containing protein n=1 Tax=Dyadobacter chenhuakuii TaxID=2909339 RepID=A0A9X1QFM2_9BACT|nr:T9SS type A sorting domain-containing protein [Dyadobacter chenhuakuii]MCF2499602.1 T9SS type A sorting domain-containing protein [Dyadobacter chenhuakuii]
MKKHLKYFFSALLLISMSQIAKSQNVNIILDFTNRKVSADGLSWTFDLEAKGDVGYAGPNNNNWKAYNIRLDLDLPDGVDILGGTGVADPNYTTGSLGVQTTVFGDPPLGQKELGLTLSRGNQTDLNTFTFVKLATYTINFSGPVDQGNPATPRPNAIASGSSWTNAANDPASGNQLGLRRPFSMAENFALPVKLLSFDATKEGAGINLNWATTEENNSDRFDVQRSSNGKEWNTITTITAKGESKQQVEYVAVDNDPINGNNFYRLHMIDKDGTGAYSRIRTVKFEGVVTYMYPNPVSEELTIKAADWSKITKVEIVGSNGKVVYHSFGKPSPNVKVKNLLNGVYLVRLTNTNGSETTHKIVVNN